MYPVQCKMYSVHIPVCEVYLLSSPARYSWNVLLVLISPMLMPPGRAGHATTLPRKRDHAFRFFYYGITVCPYLLCLLHLDTEAFTFFVGFLVFDAPLYCRVVVVAKPPRTMVAVKLQCSPIYVYLYSRGLPSVQRMVREASGHTVL